MKRCNINPKTFPFSAIIEGGTKQTRKEAAYNTALKIFCITGAACGTCNQCVKIKAGSHPDFFYFDEGAMKVDTARSIIKNAYTKPSESKYKFVIIDNADSMTVQAQNALLKAIEEPKSTYFVFLCDNHRSLLQTIVSRCQVFSLFSEKCDDLSPGIAGLMPLFAPSLHNEFALCEFFSKASALPRSSFNEFLTACKGEIYKLMFLSEDKRKQLIEIYDFLDKLSDQLVYNPDLFTLSLSACAEIWKIYNE